MITAFDSLIVDADNLSELEDFDTDKLLLITCGLSQKATVTASSIDDECFSYCIQRAFKTVSGKTLLPQEFKIRCSKKAGNLYPALETVTLLLLFDVPPAEISDKLTIFI